MIIVDADVLSSYFIQGERTASAYALRKLDSEWRAPSLWRSEFVSVIHKYVRAKVLSQAQANEMLLEALKLYRGIDMQVELGEILDAAIQCGASTYDAHYLALAKKAGLQLVTGEKRHPGARHGLAVNIDDFLKSN